MKQDYNRLKSVMLKDRILNLDNLTEIINNEVGDRLSNFIDIIESISKIKVFDDGKLGITISILANGTKIPRAS